MACRPSIDAQPTAPAWLGRTPAPPAALTSALVAAGVSHDLSVRFVAHLRKTGLGPAQLRKATANLPALACVLKAGLRPCVVREIRGGRVLVDASGPKNWAVMSAVPAGAGISGTVHHATEGRIVKQMALEGLSVENGTGTHWDNMGREFLVNRDRDPTSQLHIDVLTRQVYLSTDHAGCCDAAELCGNASPATRDDDRQAMLYLCLTLAERLDLTMDGQSAVHRDVKPQNVVVHDATSPHGEPVDFGFARLADDQPTECTASTRRYEAPEVSWIRHFGTGSFDVRGVDAYSFGLTLAELTLGVHPHDMPRGAGDAATFGDALDDLHAAAAAIAAPLAELRACPEVDANAIAVMEGEMSALFLGAWTTLLEAMREAVANRFQELGLPAVELARACLNPNCAVRPTNAELSHMASLIMDPKARKWASARLGVLARPFFDDLQNTSSALETAKTALLDSIRGVTGVAAEV